MIIDRVTITGADESITPDDLYDLTVTFPFVEWGILFFREHEGTPRYPAAEWLQALHRFVRRFEQEQQCRPRLACHVCGQWVRDLLQGRPTLLTDRGNWLQLFQRLQINTHSLSLAYDRQGFVQALHAITTFPGSQVEQFIVQIDGVNNHLLTDASAAGHNVVPLFDTSHGTGNTPYTWPPRLVITQENETRPRYCGYAGGLGPDNLQRELQRLATVIQNNSTPLAATIPVWIDMETNVRSQGGQHFDLEKVRVCLEIARPLTPAGMQGSTASKLRV